MGFIERIKGYKESLKGDPVTEKPIIIESLEPRILLSADGLISPVIYDNEPDLLLDDIGQAVQHAELLEMNAEQGQENASIQPLFTITLNEENPPIPPLEKGGTGGFDENETVIPAKAGIQNIIIERGSHFPGKSVLTE